MAQYKYRAVDEQGKAVDGTMEESSAHRVTRVLQERGLTVNSVETLYKERGLLRVSHRLTWDELDLFSQQLTAITRSELPLSPALKAMAADLRSSRLKPVLERLQQDLDRGISLEDAMSNQHESFPRIFPSVIRAGEKTGNLAGVLQLLCNYTSRMVGLKHVLQGALAYPATVLVLGSCVLGFLLVKVVPVFAEIFQEFGGELPAPTRFWVKMGDVVQFHLPEILMGAGLFLILWRGALFFLRRYETGAIWLDWIRLHTPVFGKLQYQLALSRFSRSLSILLASRVPVLESLELAAASSGSPMLQRAVDEANLQVAGGERIADALSSTGFFGHNFCWLLATSEDRGDAENALENLAGIYEREVSLRDRMVSSLASPILIVMLGFLIASVVISLYLPIFSLGDVVSGR